MFRAAIVLSVAFFAWPTYAGPVTFIVTSESAGSFVEVGALPETDYSIPPPGFVRDEEWNRSRTAVATAFYNASFAYDDNNYYQQHGRNPVVMQQSYAIGEFWTAGVVNETTLSPEVFSKCQNLQWIFTESDQVHYCYGGFNGYSSTDVRLTGYPDGAGVLIFNHYVKIDTSGGGDRVFPDGIKIFGQSGKLTVTATYNLQSDSWIVEEQIPFVTLGQEDGQDYVVAEGVNTTTTTHAGKNFSILVTGQSTDFCSLTGSGSIYTEVIYIPFWIGPGIITAADWSAISGVDVVAWATGGFSQDDPEANY